MGQCGIHPAARAPLYGMQNPDFSRVAQNAPGESILRFREVACGGAHTVALANHDVVVFGCNSHGQCGRCHSTSHVPSEGWPTPAVAPSLLLRAQEAGMRASRLAVGANFTLVVTDAGILSCGANHFGQLGRDTDGNPYDASPGLVILPIKEEPVAPTDASPEGSEAAAWKSGATGMVEDIECGDEHSIAVLSGGSVWVWGRGTQGALGLGTHSKNVVQPVMLPNTGEVKGAGMGQVGLVLRCAAGGTTSALIRCCHAIPAPLAVPPALCASPYQLARSPRGSSNAPPPTDAVTAVVQPCSVHMLPAASTTPPTESASPASRSSPSIHSRPSPSLSHVPPSPAQATLSPSPTPSRPLTYPPPQEPSSLYTWGANKNGELGHGDTAKRAVARCVKHFKSATSTSIFAVSISATHAQALVEFRVRAPGVLPRLGCAESNFSTPNHSLGASAAAARSADEADGGRADGTRRRKQTHKAPFMGGSSGGSHSGGHEKKTAEEIFNLRRKKALVLERKASQKKEKTKG